MRIQRIHLFNFRSVEDLTLDLTEDGLHALIGAFGSGKSSFLTGVRFALFGDNGAGGANLDLRRRGCPKGEEAGCEVTFTHGQDTYVARRWLRRSNTKKGPVEKTHASLTLNGNPIDGITATTLTSEMESVLGMTARAFTSASMIPQGEVATLMKAPPAEVQTLIEEHTGLDVLTKRRDQARKEAREAEITAEAMAGNEETVWDLAEQEKDAQAHVERTVTAMQERQRHSDAATEASRAAEDVVRQLRDRQTAAANHQARIAASRQRAESAADAVTALTEEAGNAGIDLNRDPSEDDAALTSLTEALATVVDGGREMSAAEAAAREAAQTADAAAAELREVQDNCATLDEESAEIDALTDQAKATISEATERLRLTHGTYTAAVAEAERLTRAITTLQSDSDGHACPTCRQHVADHDELIATLTTARSSAQSTMEQAEKAGHAARAQITEAEQGAVDLEQRGQALTLRRTALIDATREADRRRAEASAAQARVGEARQRMRNLVMQHSSEPVPADDQLLAAGREIHRVLNGRRDRLVQAAGLRNRLAQAQQAMASAAEAAREAEAAEVIAPSDQEVDTAVTTAADLRRNAEQAADELTAATAEHASASAAQKIVALQLDTARAEWEAKVEATADAAAARGEADVLTALRFDLLTELTSSICRSASDLLSGFGGEYVAFHLDDDFIPRAELSDGTLVRTAILSGGEAALVGLSFRIGITLHITGGGLPEQMIGDEITSYLDEEGRRAVLSSLASIFPSVLLISHTAEAEDYATRVHRVTRGELQPTRWVEDGDGGREPEEMAA